MAGRCDARLAEGYARSCRDWFVIDIGDLTSPVDSLTLTLSSFNVTGAGTCALWGFGNPYDNIQCLQAGGTVPFR